MDIFPVILAGGGGSRLWPLSGEDHPKQFLRLVGPRTLFQATLERLDGLAPKENLRVVCGDIHRFQAIKEMAELGITGPGKVIGEPLGRNTAPAILLAIKSLMTTVGDPILIVLPADHAVADIPAFQECLSQAVAAAKRGNIATIGIVPNAPETGYGYIEREREGTGPVYRVKRFVEKPDLEKAQAYLSAGGFLWNAGIFIFKASVMLAELENTQPDMCRCVQAFLDGDREAYARAPKTSIDYAVMEHTDKAVVVPALFSWSDLGSWSSVAAHISKDSRANSIHGDVVLEGCQNSHFHANHRLLAGVGVSDLVVVETEDAVLVCHKDRAQDVGRIADELQDREKAPPQTTEHRPWGSFTILGEAEEFKTKRLDVLPKKRLSLQSHNHRTEYWVVFQGTAKVTRGEEILTLETGESIIIPVRTKHRIENPGPGVLSLIEIQLGTYFGEDDIIRYQDDFGRLKA